jgi:outer membrane protein assembly factor BamA
MQGIFYRRLFKGAFLGLQGTYNDYFDVSFSGPILQDLVGQSGARNVGVGASFLYDTRNNILNARKGVYVELSGLKFSDRLGATYSYNSYTADFRKYFPINDRSVIAFQVLGLIKTGTVPFLQLSYLGGSDIMRGFYSGRYRDKVLGATQFEYRRQITDDWGAVAFVGLGNVTDELKHFDFRDIKNSIGVGARYMLDKKDRMNLRMDAGMGNGNLNFYIAIAEAF